MLPVSFKSHRGSRRKKIRTLLLAKLLTDVTVVAVAASQQGLNPSRGVLCGVCGFAFLLLSVRLTGMNVGGSFWLL